MPKIVGIDKSGMEIGSVHDFAGGTLPFGALGCDGTLKSTTTYPKLFAKIGYTYGGSGANFQLPPATGRTTVGAGTYTDPVSGSVTRTLGQTLGAEKHQLTATEMPSHSHSVGHIPNEVSGGGSIDILTNIAQPGSSGYTVSATGGNGNHNNMQPSIVFNKIIYYL